MQRIQSMAHLHAPYIFNLQESHEIDCGVLRGFSFCRLLIAYLGICTIKRIISLNDCR